MRNFAILIGLLVGLMAIAAPALCAPPDPTPYETISVSMSGMDVKQVVCRSGSSVRGNDGDNDGRWDCPMPGISNGDKVSLRIVGTATSEFVCAYFENMVVVKGVCRDKRGRKRTKIVQDVGCNSKCDAFTPDVIGNKVVIRLTGTYSGGTAPGPLDTALTLLSDVEPEDKTRVAVYQRFQGVYSGPPGPNPSEIPVTFTNGTWPRDNTKVAVYQKNVASFSSEAVAWEVIPKLPLGDQHVITYTLPLKIAASDEWGNFTPKQSASPGQAWAVTMTPSGQQLVLQGVAADPSEIEILNNLAVGNINAHLYREDRLVGNEGGVLPGQKAAFEFMPKLNFAPVGDSVETGDILDTDALSEFTMDIYGAEEVEVVMTKPNPAGPHVFAATFPVEPSREAVAWEVIPEMQRGEGYDILFPQAPEISASDESGNFLNELSAVPGSAYEVTLDPGPVLVLQGVAASASDIEIENNLFIGYVNIQVYYDDRLFAYPGKLHPGQKVTFTPSRRLSFVPVDNATARGDFLDVDAVMPVSTLMDFFGVKTADVVMTKPNPAQPHVFSMENIVPF